MVIFCFLAFSFLFSFLFYDFSNENKVLEDRSDGKGLEEVDLSDGEEVLEVDLEEISNFLDFHLGEEEIELSSSISEENQVLNEDEIGLPITPGEDVSDSEKKSYENKVDSMFMEYVTSIGVWTPEEAIEFEDEDKAENSLSLSKEGKISWIKNCSRKIVS